MTLQPSQSLGPYSIVNLLGRGAMGEVYRARDTRLGREVALKLLPREFLHDPERLLRFEREARAAAALNHPNLLSIYDVGTHDGFPFFVSELLVGETLQARLARGRLPIHQVIEFGRQIAEGLAAAHDHGITHRDIKPDNLFITKDERLKILDFGLAKAVVEPGVEADTTRAAATEAGAILGTVPYMSPEHLRGAPINHRTDIFALGAVLYEMLTGRMAFHAASRAETISAILTRDPFETEDALPEKMPGALVQIVRHCLDKNPQDRFQSARDVSFGLSMLTDASAPAIVSTRSPIRQRAWLLAGMTVALALAVALATWLALVPRDDDPPPGGDTENSIVTLPFTNLSGNPSDEYFAHGMTEALMTDLAKVERLVVMARSAAFRYKDVEARKAGQDLGARYVLHGSVQRGADRVRVNAHLIEVASGKQLWADRFDEAIEDLLALQDKLSRRIVTALQLQLSSRAGRVESEVAAPPKVAPDSAVRPTTASGSAPAPVVSAPATTNDAAVLARTKAQAYDAYLQGLYYKNQSSDLAFTRELTFVRAIEWLEKATTLDPSLAPAHAALGSAYTQQFFYVDADRKWEQKAFTAIERALALDSQLASAYLARAQLAWSLPNGFPHERAIKDLQRALALNPSLAEAHRELARIYLHVGLLDKSVAAGTRALRLDPGDVPAARRLVSAHVYARNCSAARILLEREIGDSPAARAEVLSCLGQHADALRVMSTVANPSASETGLLVRLRARTGDLEHARAQVGGLRVEADNVTALSDLHHLQFHIGATYALLGDARAALPWLKKATREGLPCYPLFEKDPDLDKIRSDSEFVGFLEELRLQHERFRAGL